MSRRIGLDTIFLRPTPRIAHTEYSLEYHTSLFKDSARELYDAWELDFLWCTNDGPIEWSKAGRCTDMGHAEYASDGGDRRRAALLPLQQSGGSLRVRPAAGVRPARAPRAGAFL